MTTISATPATIQVQIAAAAKPGSGIDTIDLQPGTYARVTIPTGLKAPGNPIILNMGDPAADGVIVNWMLVGGGAAGWEVQGGLFKPSPWFGIQAAGASAFKVKGAAFDLTPIPGAPNLAAAGVSFKQMTDFEISDCHFFGSRNPDAIDIVASQRGLVSKNRFIDMRYLPGGGHVDAVQFWNLAGLPFLSHIDLFDNMLIGNCQFIGYYTTSEAEPPGMSYMRLRRNSCAMGFAWGIHMLSTTNSEMTDNVAWTTIDIPNSFSPPVLVMTDGPLVTTPDSGATNLIARNLNGIKPKVYPVLP